MSHRCCCVVTCLCDVVVEYRDVDVEDGGAGGGAHLFFFVYGEAVCGCCWIGDDVCCIGGEYQFKKRDGEK